MSEKEYSREDEALARYAKALAHPARLTILRFLASQKECYFGDLHEVLPLSKATVSQHLSELKSVGLIQGNIEAPKVRYCINAKNWQEAKELFAELLGRLAKEGSCCG